MTRTSSPHPQLSARSRTANVTLGLLLLTTLMLALGAPRALALSQRGHIHAFAFGEPGSASGQLAGPSSLAVDETTGELYISDAANNRVEQYAPQRDAGGTIDAYTFKRAWGWGVKDGEKRYETCETACKEGLSGAKFFKSPGQIAVDNSTDPADPARGNVYVIANHIGETGKGYGGRVYEFGPEGEPVSTTEQHGPEGADAGQPLPEGQPPMALGTVEEEVKPGKWKRNEEAVEEEIAEELEVIVGVAVDAHGLVWLSGEDDELRALTPQGALTGNEPELDATELGLLSAPGRAGLAVQSITLPDGAVQDHLYVRYEAGGKETEGSEPKHGYCSEHECHVAEIDGLYVPEDPGEHVPEAEEGQVLSVALAGQPAAGLAVDPANGDAYIDDATTITALDSENNTIQRFGAPEGSFPGLAGASALAVNHAAGSEVGDIYALAPAAGRVDVFIPSPPGPPAVNATSISQVSAESAQLHAQIDPGGAATTYTLQYSTAACSQTPSECAAHFSCTAGPAVCGELPAPPADAGEAFGDQPVTVTLAGLAPSSTYHYRFLATNPHGQAASEHDGVFSTPPAECECRADGRLYELVSPPQKDGAKIEALSREGATIQAAANGAAITYAATSTVGQAEGNRSFEPTQLLSTRSTDGWATQDIVTPNEHGIGISAGGGGEYRFFSQDLALSILQPFATLSPMAEPPLAPPVSESERQLASEGKDYQENTVYLRDDQPLEPHPGGESQLYAQAATNATAMHNPGYLALVNAANTAPGAHYGPSGVSFIDATPDLTHAIIHSTVTGQSGCETAQLGCTPGLYETSEGRLQLINRLGGADGPIVTTGGIGANDENVRNAISGDGSRVFWGSGSHLYMRDITKTPEPETLQIDTGPEPGEEGGVEFQIASADGTRVFFTDTRPLTPQSGKDGTPDLYVCEISEDPQTHRLACKITDLTTPRQTSEGEEAAAVQGTGEKRGGVLGASQDGTSVYFVADGVLATNTNSNGETAAPGHCGQRGYPNATCNLYLEHHGTAGWPAHPTFIGRLSEEDEPDWQGLSSASAFTSRVSANGRYLAFMSERELTGYDNTDSSPEAHGAHDEEVYLYDAASGALRCVSCDPTGARPKGVYEPAREENSPEGIGLLVDRAQTWAGKWLAGNIPGFTRLAQHLFEPWALYQSRYLSNTGRLLFQTPEALVPEDVNAKQDVYEYEPAGVPAGAHSCQSTTVTYDAALEGCVGLISSGTSEHESALLDASESGGEGPGQAEEGAGDVFFITTAPLTARDTDSEFDVYDAHECTAVSPCVIPPEEKPPVACGSTDECRPLPAPPAGLASPASASPGAPGNLTPRSGVSPSKTTVKPNAKPLTSAQKLTKALESCRSRYAHSARRRRSCEAAARARYATPAAKLKRALAACRRRHASARPGCERAARRRYAHQARARRTGRAAQHRGTR